MKKVFNLAISLLLVVVFYSCSNEEISQIQFEEEPEVMSLSQRYNIAKEIAVYHSQGLEFALTRLKSIKSEDDLGFSTAFLRSSNSEKRENLVSDVVLEFMSQETIVSDFSRYENFRLEDNSKGEFLKSSLNESGKISSFFDETVKNASDLTMNELEALLEKAISSDEFSNFSEADQNLLLLTFAIFIDSANYWESNLQEWKKSFHNSQNSPQLRGWWGDLWDTVVDYAITDAKGAVAWGLAGAAGGAVGGSFAGGAGAVPGALAGGAAGAVGGAVGNSVEKALGDEEEVNEEE